METTSSIPESSHAYHDGFPIPDYDAIPLYQRIFRSRKGLILLILFGILFGGVTFVYLAAPVLFMFFAGILPHSYFRTYVDVTIGGWIYMKAYILEKCFGIKVRIFGHHEKFADRSLVILNHRCHFDWLFFWIVVGKIGDSSKWQVMMKKIGKFAPFFGWTMQTRNHFFLSRKWEADERELQWKLTYLKATNSPYQILMFPEGTDFNPKSKGRSDTYADTNKLAKYDYVLQPKSTGFIYSLKRLREYKIDAVYDITVGYPDVLAKTEPDMFMNRKIPREIHYHIRKYDASSIPEDDEGITEWLRERWNEKEQRLKTFYTHREFRIMPFDKVTTNGHTPHENGHTTHHNGHSHFNAKPQEYTSGEMSFVRFFLSQLFYTGQGSIFLFLCYLYGWCIVWGLVSACVLQYISMKTEGLDYMIMSIHTDPEFRRVRGKPPNAK